MVDSYLLGDNEKGREGTDKMDEIKDLDDSDLPVPMSEVLIDDLGVLHQGSSVDNSCISYLLPKLPNIMYMYVRLLITYVFFITS